MPCHKRLKFINKVISDKRMLFLVIWVSRIISKEEVKKLLDVVFTILIIKVNDEGDGSECEKL